MSRNSDTEQYQSVSTLGAQPYSSIATQVRYLAKKCLEYLYLMPLITIAFLLALIIFYPFETRKSQRTKFYTNNENNIVYSCHMQLIETLPTELRYTQESVSLMNTYDAWEFLLNNARKSVDIVTLNWSLSEDQESNLNETRLELGARIYENLLKRSRQIKVSIVQNVPMDNVSEAATNLLTKIDTIKLISINLAKHFGAGMLHTNFWIVDNRHFYFGSANAHWRALTNVKELGVFAQNCPVLANDLTKIFNIYRYLGNNNQEVASKNPWPLEYQTHFNALQPMKIKFNQKFTMRAYLASSPPTLTGERRTYNLDAILYAINTAVSFINIAVMDYIPLIIFRQKPEYWPFIDDALRKAVIERKVTVKLLVSTWSHVPPIANYFLRSLQDLSHSMENVDIKIRRFMFADVANGSRLVNNHKYMVTDSMAYIGSADWIGDSFVDFASVGLVLNELGPAARDSCTLRTQLLSIFERDWSSPYALNMN